MNTWTYYEGYDDGDEADYGGSCEDHFWRVSPDGRVQTINIDDTHWHPLQDPWGETYVNARPVSPEDMPPRLLTAPVAN